MSNVADGSLLLFVSVVLPFAMAFLMAWPRLRPRIIYLAPLAPAPALLLAMFGTTGDGFAATWLFKHTMLIMDETARIYLGFTSVLYMVSAWQARGYLEDDIHRSRFFAFLLVSTSGNLGIILAADIPTFYLCFALLGLASAGLVFHRGDRESFEAGRIYLVLAILGEALLFAGLTMLAARAGTTAMGVAVRSAHTNVTLALVTVGFGIKAGFLTLHFWLPLAHPAAPVPASAVLSGSMIKACLLGWLRFLPLGQEAMPTFGAGWVVLGLTAAFFGAAAGAGRRNPKTVLAYSSISQMGIMMTGIGAGLMEPDAWASILAALLVYVAHHGLAKSALFLGVSTAQAAAGRLPFFVARLGLLLPALALAGAPFTSGALAKVALKNNLTALPEPWIAIVELLLPLAAAGTTLLMARFLFLTWPRAGKIPRGTAAACWLPWGFAVVASLAGVWLLPGAMDFLLLKLTPSMIWKAIWPLLFGGALAWWLHRRLNSRSAGKRRSNQAFSGLATLFNRGIAIMESLIQYGSEAQEQESKPKQNSTASRLSVVPTYLAKAETGLRSWPLAGLLLVLILAALFVLLR